MAIHVRIVRTVITINVDYDLLLLYACNMVILTLTNHNSLLIPWDEERLVCYYIVLIECPRLVFLLTPLQLETRFRGQKAWTGRGSGALKGLTRSSVISEDLPLCA